MNKTAGRYRWTICALVFYATTVNYFDRNVIGLLRPILISDGVFGSDKGNQELFYSYVVMSFQVSYAIGMLFAGRFIDKIGTRRGYSVSLLGWSLAAIGHALAHNTLTFGFWRGALGVTESGNFPAANKTIAEWFPKKERAFATGFYNSGANIGAIVTPLFVPWMAQKWGWQWAFIFVGLIGLSWLYFWLKHYDTPAEKLKNGILSQQEYDYIHADQDEKTDEVKAENQVSWFRLLTFRQTWSFFLGKFLTDPIWWFYLFWLPAFLNGENARKVQQISWPLAVAVVYSISTFGSVFGGWFPKKLINGGMRTFRARKLSMLIYAVFPLSVLLASWLGKFNTWYAVIIIGIACAAHQAWSANIFTTVSDMFPKKAVASVTGIGGMSGAAGGILIASIAGILLKHYALLDKVEVGYHWLFIYCGIAYLLAWLVMHFLVPRLKRVDI